MKEAKLKSIFNEAIFELLKKDTYLLQKDVHEQSISSKLSCYLSTRIPSKWSVDVEYNRNGQVPKSLHDMGNVKPDIIIHKRGKNNPQGTESNNLLIVEIKKDPTNEEKAADIRKIKSFLNESPFNYCYGVFIGFTSGNEPNIEWFIRNDKK
jgi:hypothetical protein